MMNKNRRGISNLILQINLRAKAKKERSISDQGGTSSYTSLKTRLHAYLISISHNFQLISYFTKLTTQLLFCIVFSTYRPSVKMNEFF